VGTRNLLSKPSFLNTFTGRWYTLPTFTPWPYDPWIQDTPSYGADPIRGPQFGVYRGDGSFNTSNPAPHNLASPRYIPGPGLPVAYDPLWRYTTGIYLGSSATEARFASGLGFVRPDPQGGQPSAHGLQRLTNFPAGFPVNVPDIFVSPEDIVLQSDVDSSKAAGTYSSIVPDLKIGDTNATTGMPTVMNDWKYTWMFTGQQDNPTSGSAFTGSIVVFENRPFSFDPVVAPIPGSGVTSAVAGEVVVEAIFGYTNRVTGGTLGYGISANRSVLLRWPATMADPEVKVGSWIADVTYERNAAEDWQRSTADPATGGAVGSYPYQRCHWYQVAKRNQAAPGQSLPGDPAGVAYREMVVWTDTPLLALTLLRASDGSPYHVNAALVSPYVVNVFSRTFHSK
jgi:hypothetical protein